ncbi:RNA-directed DNA polymerase from mobile element jockey [Trichonephila clavipes]|nr:RNA-directed DNA polymerase from mobile element jockey [Trichonephila clavipes]
MCPCGKKHSRSLCTAAISDRRTGVIPSVELPVLTNPGDQESDVVDSSTHNTVLSNTASQHRKNVLISTGSVFLRNNEGRFSSPRPVKRGIPQGSLLGPRLFNLYIHDIPKADNVHLAMYADETAIISQHTYNFKIIERLQNYITRLQFWLVAWKIKVNASKSASLLFTIQRCIGNLPNIYIFDQPVPWVTEFKYLGFILDAKLNFSPHIRAALQKAAGMSQTLNCLISRKCKLPIRHKVLLYKLFFRPILLYASPIWASAAVTHLKKLHVFQNKRNLAQRSQN